MKAKTLPITCLCLLMLAGSLLGAAVARGGALFEARAQVLEKILKADRVLLGVRWLGKPPPGSTETGDSVTVCFKPGANGGPDLNDPANQKKLAALGPEPGDILILKLYSGPKGWLAEEVGFAASDRAVSFPGREKIAPGLVAELLSPGSEAPVIATLETDATGEQLKKVIGKLLKSLPKGSFRPAGGFDRLPILTGNASLPGLMALAASPLVKAIQSDEKAQPASGRAMPSGEALK